jgi:hypothetical protein
MCELLSHWVRQTHFYRFARPGPRGLTLVVTEQVVENAQASALLENSGLKPALRRVALSGIAAEMSVYEIP